VDPGSPVCASIRYIRYEIGSLLGFALGPIPEEDAMAGAAKKKMVPGWLRAGAFYAFLLAVGIALVVGGTVSATFALGVLRSGAPWHSVAGVVLMVAGVGAFAAGAILLLAMTTIPVPGRRSTDGADEVRAGEYAGYTDGGLGAPGGHGHHHGGGGGYEGGSGGSN
jgi:hypothetical protein